MMRVSIEIIAGKPCTVIHHTNMGLILQFSHQLYDGSLVCFYDGRHTATALPALPRTPKPGDGLLLYRYMAEGIEPIVEWRDEVSYFGNPPAPEIRMIKFWEIGNARCMGGGSLATSIHEITQAINFATGERVEVAITDGGE